MNSHLVVLERGAAVLRRRIDAGHAEGLDAWLGADTDPVESTRAVGVDGMRGWDAPCRTAELAYDTADQGLPSGVRAVMREGSRRLMFEAQDYEVLVRVVQDQRTERHEVVGQVLFGGLPLRGAYVRLDHDGPDTPILTDPAGGFRLPPLAPGAYGLSIAVHGEVLMVPPIALR